MIDTGRNNIRKANTMLTKTNAMSQTREMIEKLFWVVAESCADEMSPQGISIFVVQGMGFKCTKNLPEGDLYMKSNGEFVIIDEDGFL